MTGDESESATPRDGSDSLIQRLRDDLKRPAGGWTAGFATLLGAMAAAVAGPAFMPYWSAVASALGLLLLHMLWGAHGYYPRRIR